MEHDSKGNAALDKINSPGIRYGARTVKKKAKTTTNQVRPILKHHQAKYQSKKTPVESSEVVWEIEKMDMLQVKGAYK